MRSLVLAGLVLFAFGSALADDCSSWTLDGYHLGMAGAELLAVRSVTLHVEGQAQVIEPGKFSGALVLDALNNLETWDVRYDAPYADGLSAALRARFGEPAADVSGTLPGFPANIRQRRTIWLSKACDTAIIVYENYSVRGAPDRSVHASLTRASKLLPGLVDMKTLYP
jgi:hypothetical protein